MKIIPKLQRGRYVPEKWGTGINGYLKEKSDTPESSIRLYLEGLDSLRKKATTDRLKAESLKRKKLRTPTKDFSPKGTVVVSTTNPDEGYIVGDELPPINVPQLTMPTTGTPEESEFLRWKWNKDVVQPQQQARAMLNVGAFLNPTLPSLWVGAIARKEPFLTSLVEGNKGLGEIVEGGEIANLPFDIVAPWAVSKGASTLSRAMASPEWKYMTTFKSPQVAKITSSAEVPTTLYLTQETIWNSPTGHYVPPQIRRESFGANVMAKNRDGRSGVVQIIEDSPQPTSRVTSNISLPTQLNLDEGSFRVIPNRTAGPNDTEIISKEELDKLILDRLEGKTLSEKELFQLENAAFAHGDANSGKSIIHGDVRGSKEDLDLALNNLNRLYNKRTIANGGTAKGLTTRDISNGETPYELDELVENGRLKSLAALDETISGDRGIENWYEGKDARKEAEKYFNVVYGTPNRLSIGNVGIDNPRNRSGVIFTNDGNQFSIDSFPKALKEFYRTLKSGRKFKKLDSSKTHVESNDYGLANRYYYLNRDKEFFDEIKASKGVIPNDVKVYRFLDGSLGFMRKDEYGIPRTYKLIARDPLDIIDKNLIKQLTGSLSKNLLSINEWIDKINNEFGTSMDFQFPHARVSAEGEIEWPNMYGVFYKNGGIINNYGNRKLKIFGNSKRA